MDGWVCVCIGGVPASVCLFVYLSVCLFIFRPFAPLLGGLVCASRPARALLLPPSSPLSLSLSLSLTARRRGHTHCGRGIDRQIDRQTAEVMLRVGV